MTHLTILLSLVLPAMAQQSPWQVSASSQAVLAAESRVVYRSAPAGLKADIPASATADVLVVKAEEAGGSWTWTLLPLSTGTISFTARFQSPDGKVVEAPSVAFAVTEAELTADADIADIKGPIKAWPSPWPWLLAGVLAGLIWYGWRRWKSRRRLGPDGVPVPAKPLLPPEVIAELALKELRAAGIWETNQAAYYLRLTDILRVYLEARYAKPVTAMTSVEVERLVKERANDLAVGGSVRELLTRADLVKFAKVKPTADEGPLDADLALSLIKATTPRDFSSTEKKP